ncbi:sugar 3,4-ketoisomerase [Helicobacter sp.]|uniref:sugar 3,4-ketoisomerase n=1 Tax=Helicobacter sp. TaxID=218 RepID=UPI0025BE2E83|nr:FdtA/QdtA family cupin domain-containing protein [Helicobacter sp.]MCI5969162.1 FdtA/QdtA family cupin domain-containing protein [Helicobacter sp.]MDY2584399.1 FdtA/QdtA family cupin domain-containing protein [Helicobacter sp.]
MRYQIIDFDFFKSKDSILVAMQHNTNCPFVIARVFYIYGVPCGATRGDHANVNSRFLFVALKGSCKIKIDDGRGQEIIKLDSATRGLYLDKMLWKQMFEFSKDCVLLVLSDCYYDKDEYIYDYNKYCSLVRGGGHIIDALAA